MNLNKIKKNKVNGDIKNMEHKNGDLVYSNVDEDSNNFPEFTIPEAMKAKVDEHPHFPALRSKSSPNGKFDITITMSEYLELTRRAARNFIKLGLDVKASVGILGFNHAAWCISQFGSIFAGGITCGIYATNTADVCKFIINDCCCQIIVVENTMQLNKIMSIVKQCPQIKAIIQYTGTISDEYKTKTDVPLYTWAEFMNLGDIETDSILNSRIKNIKPRDTALLIYTSGTTGMPKGVMLSHDNILWASRMALDTVILKPFSHSTISYLPLSHVAANLVDVISVITLGITIYFAQPDALKGSLGVTLKEVRPTLFLGVPRVFEKIQEQMQELGSQTSGFKKIIATWAKQVGFRNSKAKQAGKSSELFYPIANCLVFSQVKKALGLDRCSYLLSGAAPITQQTIDYFLSLDIMIQQVYGMSECSGPQTLGRRNKMRIGSAGSLMKGAEMKIVNPDENGVGEICMRGRHVFLGYYNDEERTREVIDEEGWLHSGDIGKLEDNEFLRITGRIKEILITAGGENVAPVPVEDKIKEKLSFVSNVMLIGDRKKFISCLLTLKTVIDPDTQEPTKKLTPAAIRSLAAIGIEASDVDDVVKSGNAILNSKIDNVIKEVNDTSISRAAFVQKWSFLQKDFSINGGELGPTMKMKRSVITEMYKEIIDEMYN